jgi:hypothetical protein
MPGGKIIWFKHLMPELLDSAHFGEEPVTTNVESPTITFNGATDATNLGV